GAGAGVLRRPSGVAAGVARSRRVCRGLRPALAPSERRQGRLRGAMHGREILENLLKEHAGLRERLREWEAALHQASGSSYAQCQHAVGVLRELCQVFEHELRHHIREEETVLYPTVAYQPPPPG